VMTTLTNPNSHGARGRIALSGVDLRPPGPGGGSKRTSFREVAGFTGIAAVKSRKLRGKWPGRRAKPFKQQDFTNDLPVGRDHAEGCRFHIGRTLAI
jgi:hypothetical protein